jgi:hypothetical protein
VIFFQRLFAAYYFILIRPRRIRTLRHFSLGGTEDFGAMCLVLISQLLIFGCIFFLLRHSIGSSTLSFSGNVFSLRKIFALLILAIWLYAGNKYFLSDRNRRNKFIESFRSLTKKQKLYWYLMGIFFLSAPIWLIIYSLLKH